MWAGPRQLFVHPGFLDVISENPIDADFARTIVSFEPEENSPLIKTQEAPKIPGFSFSHPRRGVDLSFLRRKPTP